MYFKMLIIALITVLHIHAVTCHIRLTFPQARYPPLDFLDNGRTTPPCGVPKPPPELGIRTSLKAGSTFNVTWSLAYPHQGGFRIEILDSDDQVRQVLTPEKQHYTGEDNPTTQIYQVTLPREECENCAIRLMRQAAEWSEGYQFWSCADVNILLDAKEKCSHHGKFENDRCQCEKLFSGPFCQYEDECSIDDDCGGVSKGKCQELESNSYPKRVCFCQPGYFGSKCLEESPLKTVNFDPTLYESKTFGEEQQNKLFWRILEESSEIEMIMQYPSHTWIALGWKPKHLSAQCADLHTIIEKYYNHYPISVGQSTNNAERKVSPKPVLEPGSKSDNMTTKVPLLTSEPVTTKNPDSPTHSIETLSNFQTSSTAKPFKQDPETSIDIVPFDTQSTPNISPFFQFSTVSPSSTFNNVTFGSTQVTVESATGSDEDSDEDFSFSVLQGQEQSSAPNVSKPAGPYPPGGLKPLNEQEPEVIGDACYGEWRWPPNCRDCDYKLSWTYIDENDEIEFSLETKAADNAWSGVGFSSNGQMNGADFLIIKAMEGKLTIQDAYVANSQTPQLDQQQNLKSNQVVGTHVNGVLRAAFSRPRKTTDTEHDVQFTNADCFYFLFPTSSGNVDKFGKLSPLIFPPKISRQQVCVKTCNPSGTSVPVRKSCEDTFKFPPGCRPPACDYMASWSYNPILEMVNFTISARELGRWTGIGFSKDGHMIKLRGNFHWSEADFQSNRTRNTVSDSPISANQFEVVHRVQSGSDIVVGWVYENKTYMTDRFAYGNQLPTIDRHQDLINVTGQVQDEIQTVQFSRKLVPDDTSEDLSLKECLYFIFPVGGGRILARSSSDLHDKTTVLGFHDLHIPKVSQTPICICSEDGISVDGSNITEVERKRSKRQNSGSFVQTTEQEYEDEDQTDTSASFVTEAALEQKTPADSSSQSEAPKSQSTSPNAQPEPLSTTATTRKPLIAHPEPEPKSVLKPRGNPEPEPISKTQPKAEPEPSLKPAAEPEPNPHGHHHHGDDENGLHPMDCTDMIVGSAIGQLSRIQDFYTISRATPLLDEEYGGRQSLTAAVGSEVKGLTTVMFRRKLQSTDSWADYNITAEPMTVIWAKGQETGSYNHSPDSGIELLQLRHGPSKPFYGADVLAYHGSKNRGHFTLNFFEKEQKTAPSCRGEKSHPSDCRGALCQYNITWMKVDDHIDFIMDVKLGIDRWTGIGFSKDGSMLNADAIIVSVSSTGPVEITDRFMPKYARPLIDKLQNVFNLDAQYANGRVKARFSRPLSSTDDQSQDVDLADGCVFFLYPMDGGSVRQGEIQKHAVTPDRSEKICLSQCTNKDEPLLTSKPAPEPEPEPQSKKFLIIMRLMNHQWTDELANSKSDEYFLLSRKVLKEVDDLLSKRFKGFKKAQVVRFRQGSVVADVNVLATGLNEHELFDAVSAPGNFQRLQVDPESVQVREVQEHLTAEEIRNYVIISVATVLVIIATLFAACLFCRSKRRHSEDLNGMPHPSTYQYGSAQRNFHGEKQSFENQGFRQDYHSDAKNMSSKPGMDNQRATANGARSETTYSDWYNRVAGLGDVADMPPPNVNQPATAGTCSIDQMSSVSHQATPMTNATKNNGIGGYIYGGAGDNAGLSSSSTAGPYVQYPNDPYGYYTLNGGSRMVPRGGYYAPY